MVSFSKVTHDHDITRLSQRIEFEFPATIQTGSDSPCIRVTFLLKNVLANSYFTILIMKFFDQKLSYFFPFRKVLYVYYIATSLKWTSVSQAELTISF